ncbi:DapH/DapD/GlmU-related protein [Clostridium tertium]|uniref:UDP-3-O-(3-hydroxymyristoyl)glucosamine N-acyltransferase n=1 Tax=Clostridium tertium TaxID=1559 RepID=A0A9X3XG36_9CLOT|nr:MULTISPECIES: UDP-3-O-(3-hydroxymyristoyl)glucosamine N-acyltransferase [Clostridium]EEH96880.2 UDP-3-O-[3-hydroxymyristoyl] glucosamine N-acyltransferase [Clostridium sp. 7_2_43FAA]MDB1948025.1 DapH/DapD/GlmU-related protein [Clostridium tertium]MDC4238593.1 UDP-3-O-(3-hydroxymyristoyl)glucosamine N-acyltransferase [Clostridium tertium]
MLLSEILALNNNFELFREGDFSSLGLNISEADEKLLSFIESEKFLSQLSKSISCVITTKEMASKIPENIGVIISEVPRIDFFNLHNKLIRNKCYKREDFETEIGENCSISPTAIISNKNVKIGNNVVIEEYVIIREHTTIKDNCIIRANTVIGGEGYEFKRYDNKTIGVDHIGGVIIEENAEIQYSACIDKAIYPWDNTIIGEYSRIDNLVHIAHAVKVGKRCFITSKTTIGGRTIIGDDCWFGIGATVSNGLIIGNNSSISLGAVVTRSLKENSKVSGNFAIDHNKYIDFIKSIR